MKKLALLIALGIVGNAYGVNYENNNEVGIINHTSHLFHLQTTQEQPNLSIVPTKGFIFNCNYPDYCDVAPYATYALEITFNGNVLGDINGLNYITLSDAANNQYKFFYNLIPSTSSAGTQVNTLQFVDNGAIKLGDNGYARVKWITPVSPYTSAYNANGALIEITDQ